MRGQVAKVEGRPLRTDVGSVDRWGNSLDLGMWPENQVAVSGLAVSECLHFNSTNTYRNTGVVLLHSDTQHPILATLNKIHVTASRETYSSQLGPCNRKGRSKPCQHPVLDFSLWNRFGLGGKNNEEAVVCFHTAWCYEECAVTFWSCGSPWVLTFDGRCRQYSTDRLWLFGQQQQRQNNS